MQQTVSAEAEAIMTEISMVFPHFLPMNVQTVPLSTDKLSNITEPFKAQ